MSWLSVLVISLLFLNRPAVAISYHCGKLYSIDSKVYWKTQRLALEIALQNSNGYRQTLEKSPPSIAKVIEEVSNGGSTHRGVYRVQLVDGKTMILKISKVDTHETRSTLVVTEKLGSKHFEGTFNESLVIQNELANVGVSPKVHALYDSKRLKALFPELKKAHPALRLLDLIQEPVMGILMDDMGDVWNGAGRVPINFKVQTTSKPSKEKFQLIADALKELRIFIPDLQIFVNPQGDVYLADLDFAIYTKSFLNPINQEGLSDIPTQLSEQISEAVPFGYSHQGRRYEKDAYEQWVLKKMNDLSKQRFTSLQIANWLNKNKYYGRSQRPWVSSDIQRVLNSSVIK